MAKRRVLLLWTQPLLSDGLKNILSQLEDVELLGSWALTATIFARLVTLNPEIILIAEDSKDSEIVTRFMGKILNAYPNLPVVRIGLQEDEVHIYTSRTLPARSADLIEVIRNLPKLQS